uniref:Uncharacterized protein n=1 Tax=Siphoviridae sp. ct0d96 TaxID=2826268 RepID=A0A8S5M4C9_9CAUD|nr:MAG TPA: hypothetical protein [Siphoviridae sp. ct0d96]DAR67178.1 MAG TPA: hypothetical protein [Caudoviricetes sp.]DAX78327.1 MAG TPA: hypothetical protein [Caudoviricetes sp.]
MRLVTAVVTELSHGAKPHKYLGFGHPCDKCDNFSLYSIDIYLKPREKRPRRRIYARI